MYLNQVYYGDQAYGIEAAAATYFGQSDLSKLTLPQMALLAGLPQAPSQYDPVTHPATARARRAQVLDAMVDNGYITREQADAAEQDPIVVRPVSTPIYAPWFVWKVRDQLASLYGQKAAYEGGYTVYSSLDWNMQHLAVDELRSHVRALNYANTHNGALITMDPTTGEILAYVGSVDWVAAHSALSGGRMSSCYVPGAYAPIPHDYLVPSASPSPSGSPSPSPFRSGAPGQATPGPSVTPAPAPTPAPKPSKRP